jgi:hypothetical protein
LFVVVAMLTPLDSCTIPTSRPSLPSQVCHLPCHRAVFRPAPRDASQRRTERRAESHLPPRMMRRLFGHGQQQPSPSSNNKKHSIGAATTAPFLVVNDEPSATSLLAHELDPPAPMVGMKPAAQQQPEQPLRHEKTTEIRPMVSQRQLHLLNYKVIGVFVYQQCRTS